MSGEPEFAITVLGLVPIEPVVYMVQKCKSINGEIETAGRTPVLGSSLGFRPRHGSTSKRPRI